MDWFTQICLAIKHIHDKKILHRDLKSQNIFLTKNGLIKLGDFGIAKCLNFTLEKVRTVVGTPYYLSPEIVENKPYSFNSDIWSLGVLLYEMVCLNMPFDASSLPMLYVKIIRGAYNPLPNCFTKDLRNLVSSLLTVDSEKRPGINDIFQKLNLTPFVYNSQIPKTFKLVLTWDFKLKNNETKKQIIKCDADHEFIMQLDNNKDKETLINMIRSSEMNLEEKIKEKLKPSGLEYGFPYQDYNATADQILKLVR